MSTKERYKIVNRRIIDTETGFTAKLGDLVRHLNEDADTISKLESNLSHTLEEFRETKNELRGYRDKYGDEEMSEEQLYRVALPEENEGRGTRGHIFVYASSENEIFDAMRGAGWGVMGTDVGRYAVREAKISSLESLKRGNTKEAHIQ